MNLIKTSIEGVTIIETKTFSDARGEFTKNLCPKVLLKNNMTFNFTEAYYSTSKRNVIRGMHFQLPPHNVAKLVTVLSGAVLDVVLDLRTNSKTYGDYIEIELSKENKKSLIIPFGCAHGFQSLADDTLMAYFQTGAFSAECDRGIAFNSFGKKWDTNNHIMSERDLNHISFSEFQSPFRMEDE